MRLFVALNAPPEVHKSIEEASRPLDGCLGVKVLAPDSYHITLKFLGDVDEGRLDGIISALYSVQFSPFKVRLFGAGAYPNVNFPRAIWIGGESPEAEELSGKVDAALSGLGFARDEKFSVHLTVGRAKTVGDIEEFLKKTGDVCEWEADSFTLMKSRLLPQGASYEALREFPAKA